MNKGHFRKYICSIGSFLTIFIMSHCGGGSPGPNIPAPVGELMSISSPDVQGLVKVSGMNGAVFPQAKVIVTNVSIHKGDNLINGLKKAPYLDDLRQQTTLTQVETIADINGAFEVFVRGAVKDEVEVVQVFEGEVSDATELIVPPNVFSVKSNLSHLAVNPYENLAVAIGNDDTNGLVYMLQYDPDVPLYSHPEPTLKFSQSHRLSKIALHPTNNTALIISHEDNVIIDFLTNSLQTSPYVSSIKSPLSININPDVSLAVLGLEGSHAVQIYDMVAHEPTCMVKINNSLAESSHVQTKFVDIKLENQENIILVAASDFDDGSIVMSRIAYGSCDNPVLGISQLLLPPNVEVSGLASFDFGNKAVVSDANSNRVYMVDFNALKIIPMIVGDSPREIFIDELFNSAYVANAGDNSVSFINLLTRQVKTQEHIGLMPSALGVFYNLDQAAVFSSFDNTLVFIDMDF